MAKRIIGDDEARFLSYVRVDKNGCWIWQAATTGPYKYSVFRVDGRNIGGHIWAYEHFVGPVPDGLVLDHLCDNPTCVNPYHLRACTQRENVLRSRSLTAENARKTHCPKGHEYTPENTYYSPKGDRRCKTCRVEVKRIWYAANRDRIVAERRARRRTANG